MKKVALVSRQKSNKIEEKSGKNKIQSLKTFRLVSTLKSLVTFKMALKKKKKQ